MTALTDRIYAHCLECGDCLIWQGTCVRGRSPQIRLDGKSQSVRRVLWQEEQGPIPAGKEVAVTCETRNCIAHIEPQSHSKIAKRAAATGVFALPVRCSKIAAAKRQKSKLTAEQVADIRYGGGTLQEAADRNGISKGGAGLIRRGERWKDYASPWAQLGSRP